MRITPKRSLLTVSLCFVVLFVVAAIVGCGGGGGGGDEVESGETATLNLQRLLALGVPSHVTTLRFTGRNIEDDEVYEEELPKEAAAQLTVPASLRTMQVEYLADETKVGVAYFDTDLVPGQEFIFIEPGEGIPTFQALKLDILINADMWESEPRMIAAGLGFTEIIGVPGLDATQPEMSEQLVRAAGGTWNSVSCAMPNLGNYTSAVTPQQVLTTYGVPVVGGDGLPVEFSWPLRPSTLDPTDFRVILNDGSSVTPEAASITPNLDYNERAVAVLFGRFGNRLSPENPLARYPARIEVVEDSTPLELVGPGGEPVSAVGMFADAPGSPYTDPDVAPEERGGPILVGAKLSRLSAEGDTAPPLFAGNSPNDGVALYGDAARYRLRVFTSGGFSPDGVRAVYPTEFSRYFRLHATNDAGEEIQLTETGVPYEIDGGTVQILGLAELGVSSPSYDDCYNEDQDNQIDIILTGDESAVRRITHVDVPSVAPYSPFYNPGGPGNQPTPGVRYSAPSPTHSREVLIALDDPMTVTFIDLRQ